MSLLTLLGIGGSMFILGRFSAPIASFFQKLAPALLKWATSLDDKVQDLLPQKLVDMIPPETLQWMHDRWDAAATFGVTYAEGIVGTKEFWDQFLYIIKGNRALIPSRVWALLSAWLSSGGKEADIPAEVQPLVNQVKSVIAAKVMAAHVVTLPVDLQPTSAQITTIVDGLAPAVGRSIAVLPPRPDILHRPVEMQAEVEKMRAEVAGK